MPRSFARTFGQDLMRGEHVVGGGGGKVKNGLISVKVSAKMARLAFHGCDPDYIAKTCRAKCCESSTAPGGTMITIHESERQAIEAAGGTVTGGFLSSNPKTAKCPFKTAADLCGLHFTDHKPFGCIASPFTLNANGTLIVRNRYKMLRCYNVAPMVPAYKAFRAGLDLIFGAAESARICAHLDSGGGDIHADMPERSYRILTENDKAKHAKSGGLLKMSDSNAKYMYGKKDFINGKDVDVEAIKAAHPEASGTSIFDPVLTELAYRWFCPPGGMILDPFAGGSVRGIVAAKLGRRYFGVDLRAEQVAANREQLNILGPDDPAPVWAVGDSLDLAQHCGPDWAGADFVFSCPPYADLERYSDDPQDLSTMAYPEFRAAMDAIIGAAAALLKPDRFACFVVGDVRDAKGNYYGFPWHIVQAFEAAGMRLYNDAVLVTAVGSLPIRAGRAFESGRKLGKTHQNVLVFLKGDAKKATAAIGPVEFGEIEEAAA